MIYKFLHFWFGWDYIYWTDTVDQGIARVHVNEDGQPYYWRYKNITVMGRITKERIESGSLVFLTGSYEDYL